MKVVRVTLQTLVLAALVSFSDHRFGAEGKGGIRQEHGFFQIYDLHVDRTCDAAAVPGSLREHCLACR